MTKAELILQLSNKFPRLTQVDIKLSVEVILNSIGDSLVTGNRTEIRGFGSFSRHTRNPRVGRNPKTGQRVEVSAKAAAHFKCSKELLHTLNQLEEEIIRLAAVTDFKYLGHQLPHNASN
ncbi:HU family DNA-binding protein [Methyloradius palustris]|uniref:HU family DNA-binding protein n=1 Tax=Methyloradius palustris TaxID=2778876 RepID=UPI001C8B5C33|nr:HU family DNA-binding protein [Methyloradius palustris]